MDIRTRPGLRASPGATWAVRALTFAPVGIAHALMVDAVLREGSFPGWGGVALGGTLLGALVLFRQSLGHRGTGDLTVADGPAGPGMFRAATTRTLGRDARVGRYTAVLVIEVTGLDELDDTAGHRVLRAFADLLRRGLPPTARAARLGGAEFAVVLPGLGSPGQAHEIAGRLAADTGPVVVDGRLTTLACAIGVAVSAPAELTTDEIVHRAGDAMHRARMAGPQTRWAAWQNPAEHRPPVTDLPTAA